jgi:Protein of unknown function (DUF2683)
MVQAIVDVTERTNWLLNLIKAKYSLRTKSESIDKMAEEYENNLLEPQLRPEYVRKLRRISKQKPVHVGGPKELKAYFESMRK